MNRLNFLSHKETQKIEEKLKLQFGIEKIPGQLAQRGKERIFLFQGSFKREDLKNLEFTAFIERIGLYFAKIVNENEIRLSIEGVYALKDQISKNIFELNKEQAEQWMLGNELNIQTGKKGFLVMKYKDNYLGCGKASAEKIGNFVPKTRRLKQKN